MHTIASGVISADPTSSVALVSLRSAATRLGEHLSRTTMHRRFTEEQALLRALDLRCKLEQLVVMPALRETCAVRDAPLENVEQELFVLRERIASAIGAAVAPGEASESIVIVTGAVMTHFDRMDAWLCDPACAAAMEAFGLASEIEAWTQRWIVEIDTTGDIEDEEQDPVGMPPR